MNIVSLVFLLLSLVSCALPAQSLGASFRGTRDLAEIAVDQHGVSFDVFGLSGLMWLGGERFVAVNDKLVFLDLRFDSKGAFANAEITGGLTISEFRDYEGMCWADRTRNSIYLADEGAPAVLEFDLATGDKIGELLIPSIYSQISSGLGVEALSRHLDFNALWISNEENLIIDGPTSVVSGSGGSALVRLQRFTDLGAGFVAQEQYAYRTRSIHGIPIPPTGSGLVDLAALPNGRLIALERSVAIHLSGAFRTAIYEVDFSNATDISDGAFDNGLPGTTFTEVSKQQLWSGIRTINQNVEGLALGPKLPSGGSVLIGIVDGEGLDPKNQVVAWELTGDIGDSPEQNQIAITAPSNAQAGSTISVDLENVPATSPCWILWSTGTSGSLFDSHNFDLGPNVELAGMTVADQWGNANWPSPIIPISAQGISLFLEAAAPMGALWADSPAAQVQIQ